MNTRVKSFILLWGLISVAAFADTKDPSKYPLRVHIVDVHGSTSTTSNIYGNTLSRVNQGSGHGNIEDGHSWRGFDYVFECEEPLDVTPGDLSFEGRWKKPETRLVILIPEVGNPKKQAECELRTTLRDFVYGYQFGGLVTYTIEQYTKMLAVRKALPNPPPMPTGRIQLSGAVQQAKLLSHVPAVYPPSARQAQIQGVVVLHSILGKDGTVEDLQVVSGHPILAQAALDAVRQWRYQPTLLNGVPVEVDTTITVMFVLGGGTPTGQTVSPTVIWKVQDVAYAPWTLTLRIEGNIVNGTVSQEQVNPANGRTTTQTSPVEIYDGTIQGNMISFKCKSPGPGDRTITFSGEIKGDEISFTREVEVRPGGNPGEDGIYGASGASHFTAKRDSSIK